MLAVTSELPNTYKHKTQPLAIWIFYLFTFENKIIILTFSNQNQTPYLTKTCPKAYFKHLLLEENTTVRYGILFLRTSKVGSAGKLDNMALGINFFALRGSPANMWSWSTIISIKYVATGNADMSVEVLGTICHVQFWPQTSKRISKHGGKAPAANQMRRTHINWPSIATKFLLPLFHSRHYMFRLVTAFNGSVI
jgi:hypothetical protein